MFTLRDQVNLKRARKKARKKLLRLSRPRSPGAAVKLTSQGAFDKKRYESNDRMTWEELKLFVYKRDGYTCQRCGWYAERGERYLLRPHHKIPLSKGGRNTPSNLTTECEGCHRKEHRHLQRQGKSKQRHQHAHFAGKQQSAKSVKKNVKRFYASQGRMGR